MNGKYKNSFHVFVVSPGFSAVGIAVDRIAGQREIVVRPIEDSLVRVPGIAGATELGDGRPVLILDVAAIVDTALKQAVFQVLRNCLDPGRAAIVDTSKS
jgi:chemotaxis protein histidine kinase CheA